MPCGRHAFSSIIKDMKVPGRCRMSGLFGSPILEVAVGLFFLYFLLSLIASHISEILAGLLKLRARDLEKGIENLLCDPQKFQAFFDHQLIKGMGNTAAETAAVEQAASSSSDAAPASARDTGSQTPQV